MDKLQKKTKSETRTSYLRRNRSLFLPGKRILSLLLISIGFPLFAGANSSLVSGYFNRQAEIDAPLYQGMQLFNEGRYNESEHLLRQTLVTASAAARRETRYRLGLLYLEMINNHKLSREEGLRRLTVLGYGELSQPDLRLRALLCELWASEGDWSMLMTAVERAVPEDADPDSLSRIRMMKALASLALHKDEDPLLKTITTSHGAEARASLLALLDSRPELVLLLSPAGKELVRLLQFLERGNQQAATGSFLALLDLPGNHLPGSSLYMEVVRRAGFGASAHTLLQRTEQLLRSPGPGTDQRGRLLEAAGFLARRTGRFTDSFAFYTEALETVSWGATDRQRLVWYRFDALVRIDLNAAVSQLPILFSSMEDPRYFDDVFASLLDRLIERRMWEVIDLVTWNHLPRFSPNSAARWAYVSARAREIGFLVDDGKSGELYRSIMMLPSIGVSVRYYKILAYTASGSLKENNSAGWTIFYPPAPAGPKRIEPFSDELGIVEAMLAHGLGDEAESELERLESAGLKAGRELVISLASASMEKGHYLKALHRLERFLSREGVQDLRELKLLYPKPFAGYFSDVILREELDESVFYALVREESHFTADIYSHAGAVGLSQLMPATARDVAQRMGLPLPAIEDLHDPALNLSIGGWYLAHLLSRTDTLGEALFAYNGGLTRVRRWKEENRDLSDDLFPEAIPFVETQHYGRKLLVSSSIYRYLYLANPEIRDFALVESFFPDR
jgi:soluble lytic murein transglycosylase